MHADTNEYRRYSVATPPNAAAVVNPRRVSRNPFAGSAKSGPVKVNISMASAASRARSTSRRRTDSSGSVRIEGPGADGNMQRVQRNNEDECRSDLPEQPQNGREPDAADEPDQDDRASEQDQRTSRTGHGISYVGFGVRGSGFEVRFDRRGTSGLSSSSVELRRSLRRDAMAEKTVWESIKAEGAPARWTS